MEAKTLRVLLAEDSESIAILLEAYLKRAGLSVEVVDDGLKACERFEAGSYDAVVLDMRMPVLDGYEAARRMRAFEAKRGDRRVPIIALTANLQPEEVRRSLEAGCTSFLAKPFSKDDLLGLLRQSAAPAPAGPTVAVDAEIADLVPGFLERHRREAMRLTEILGKGDYAELAEGAHKLVGSGGSYGFAPVTELARELEAAARARDGVKALDALKRLDAYLKTVRLSHG